MAKTKKQSTQAPPAAGQQIIKHYTQHAEESGKTTIEGSTDGYSLYRAIARQVIGFPARFLDIRNAVLQFYLRVYANKLHPLHGQCMQQETYMRKMGCKYQLFALLDSPDLDPNEHVLWVIAYALKVRTDIYESISDNGEPTKLIHSIGPQDRPVCTFVREDRALRRYGTCSKFASLLPDESGKALIEYILSQKEEAAKDLGSLQIKQISWSWILTPNKTSWSCFNEYRGNSSEASLEHEDVRNRMDTFVVTVNQSSHVLPALELMRETLRRAPNQRRWARHSHNKYAGFMLPHCSVDAEFVKLTREEAEREDINPRSALDDGELEELCSVLTFAVGRHLFLIFNIVHMLETSDKETVSALTTLFRATIFNKGLLKLWWNPQNDIAVLDGTIAHMYQKTVRPTYIHNPYNTDWENEIVPRWRIKRNHFQNARPDDLRFPTEDIDCELHSWGANEQGIACCCRLGNIDIAALFAQFSRSHGMANNHCKKMAWTEHRHRFRYGDLLDAMLEDDPSASVLDYMKDRVGKTGKSRDRFYQDMGQPGMETEDDVMAYNIGDVAGQNMIFEQLLASDDKEFVAYGLTRYGNGSYCGDSKRKVPQRPSVYGSVGGIRLWEDNPKSSTEPVFLSRPYSSCCPTNELYRTGSLLPWEHDQRVRLTRKHTNIYLGPDEEHYSGAYVLPSDAYSTAASSQTYVLRAIQDPTRLSVSGDCVQKVDPIYEDPIVRAGTTHSEALLELLKSSKCSATHPPPGFGAGKGDPNGLPAWINRVPGKGLDQARNLFEAFEHHDKDMLKNLGNPQSLPPQTIGWLMESAPDPDKLFEEALEPYRESSFHNRDDWSVANFAKYDAEKALEAVEEKNAEEGLPYSLDTRDCFDLEGREYQRRAEQAQAWNRPLLAPKITLNDDGRLQSLAALRMDVLGDEKRLPDGEGFEEVVSRKQKRNLYLYGHV